MIPMKLSIFRGIADGLFPERFTCELCGIEIFEGRFCPDCFATLTFNDGATCPVCGRKTAREEICTECKANLPRFRKAVSPLTYEGGGVRLIYKFKDGRHGYLKNLFAELLADKLAALPAYDVITYVPMTLKAERKRGYNQSRLLAEAIAGFTDKPVAHVLEKHRETSVQKGLSRRERMKNLTGSFTVSDRAAVKGKRILLVDDVLTTGATADSIAEKLLGAGAERVYLATVCSVEYKPTDARTTSEI